MMDIMENEVTKRNTIQISYTDAYANEEFINAEVDPTCPKCEEELTNIGICEYACLDCELIVEVRGTVMTIIGELKISHDMTAEDLKAQSKLLDAQEKKIKELEMTVETLKRTILRVYSTRPAKSWNEKYRGV